MRPIVVFDNIIYSLQKAGGISAFWAMLTSKISESGLFDCYYIEYPCTSTNLFRSELEIPAEKIINGKKLFLNSHRLLEPYIPPELTRSPFIFHSSYYRTFTHPNALNVSTFHDLTHEHGGDGNLITRPLMKMVHRNVLKKSKHIVCVSRHCKKDIGRFFPKLLKENISVAYNAPVNVLSDGESKESETDYLLFVGARDDYKNFFFAVRLAMETGLPLRVAGPAFNRKEMKWIKQSGATVILHEYPDSVELSDLYRGALALIFMSEYEGFGIPPVEAQMAGCPVLCLRRSALPEIVGEGAIVMEELNLQQAKEYIASLRDLKIRADLIERGKENAKRFDWDVTARHYIKIYQKLLNRSYLSIKS